MNQGNKFTKDEKLRNKKTTIVIATVCFVAMFIVTIKLWVSFVLNEIFISEYEEGIYNDGLIKTVMLVNFPEEYVAHYNLGNTYYKNGAMEAAKKEYLEALNTVPDDRICDVRLNLGLTMAAMIDRNSNNLKEGLEEIENELLEDGCATKDSNGRHAGAQKLYNEIMKLLENDGAGGSSGSDPEEKPQQSDPEIDEDELEMWLRAQAEEAQYEHNNDDLSEEYEYYDGKTW